MKSYTHYRGIVALFLKKKRTTIVPLILIIILAVSGCGDPKTESKKESVLSEKIEGTSQNSYDGNTNQKAITIDVTKEPRREFSNLKNQAVSIGDCTIEIPEYYGDNKSDNSDVLTYYAELGTQCTMLSICVIEYNKTEEDFIGEKEKLLHEFISGMNKVEQIDIQDTDIKKQCFLGTITDGDNTISFDGKIEGKYFDGNAYIIYLIQSKESQYDYFSDFEKIIATLKLKNCSKYISDEELLSNESHPKLLDDFKEAEAFWGDDNRVDIQEGYFNTQNSDNPIISITARGDTYKGYSKYKLNEIETIDLYFYECEGDFSKLSLQEVLPIVESYLPGELINDKFHVDSSLYWTDEEGLQTYQKIYTINDGEKEENETDLINRVPDNISFFIIVDENEHVKWARITRYDTFSTNIKSIEYHDWEYDYLNSNEEKEALSHQKAHYDETLEGRGRADDGWDEPEYIGVIGYAVISATQAHAIENKENFEDIGMWSVPTYEKDKQFWNEIGIIPHKTEVVVREQILHHEGHGFYSGYLLVETTNNKTKYYIDVQNFVTKPYWTYQTDLLKAAMIGDFVAQYKQVSKYYPVDSGGKKLEIPEGTIVLVTGVTGTSSLYNSDETGIEAVVWKEWKNGYGGVKCHFNENDLIIVD